ncbi:hypothetical protein [Aquimarina agarilytica]|uniref:hypothetical protein n=1 Tax=Aquimarina agarilytica TaxID=1087449 RepID=UPI0002889AF9|nr:hypothetical protein [Aquimarina agarilytica]
MTKYSLLLFFFIGTIAHGQEYVNASDYVYAILKIKKPIEHKIIEYTQNVANGLGLRKTNSERIAIVELFEKGKKEINKFPAFNNSTALKEEVLQYFENIQTLYNNEYQEIDILRSNITSAEAYGKYMGLELEIYKKSRIYNKAYKEAEINFGNRNNIVLLNDGSDQTQKGKKINEVLLYKNRLQTFFYNMYVLDTKIMNGLRDYENPNKLEENNKKLKSVIKNAESQVSKLSAFDKDNLLKEKMTAIITLYKKQSEENFSKVITYHKSIDELDKLGKKLKSLSQEELTQEKIKEYNNLGEQIMEDKENYGNLLSQIQKIKTTSTKDWSLAVKQFIVKHVPDN